MATFFGGVQVESIFNITKSYNTSGVVNEVIYTVPTGYLASIVVASHDNWDSITIAAYRNYNGTDVSFEILINSEISGVAGPKVNKLQNPFNTENVFDENDTIKIIANGYSDNPSVVTLAIILYKKP